VAFSVTEFRRALANWHRRNGRDLPWRKTRDPYAVLVSEFMLQQTQVATVIPYYEAWLCRFPNFASLARASEDDALRAWQGLGYYARARNLHATARMVLQNHCGQFPSSIDRMRRLPGIGKYTAHAVASFAFNQSVPIVEANTARVLTRLFNFQSRFDSSAGRKKLWQYAGSLIPKSNAWTYNSALVDLGAVVCLPRKPNCPACPVKKFCRAQDPATLPVKTPKPRTERTTEKYAFVFKRGRILLERSRRRWCGMWILPPLQIDGQTSEARAIYQSVFPFTHHQITLAVYRHAAPRKIAPEQQWVQKIEDVPIPSPHRRAIEALVRNNGNFSVQREQHQHTRRSRQDRNRDADARVIPKTDLQMFPCGFQHDHIGNGANDRGSQQISSPQR
jgi:A/G-specific adenine glycosylase